MRFVISAFAVVLFLTPARAQEKTFDSNGVKIAYLDEGQGEAVVLLHGFCASSEEMWTPGRAAVEPVRPDRQAEAEHIPNEYRAHAPEQGVHEDDSRGVLRRMNDDP